MFTHEQTTTLKRYLTNQMEKIRRIITPPNKPTATEFDRAINDMRFIRDLLKDIEQPKEAVPPAGSQEQKSPENDNYRRNSDKADPAKQDQTSLPR